MKSVQLTAAVTYRGTIVDPGNILMLPIMSAQALVDEDKAFFVEVEIETEEN